uniref:Uncharacterized protein n=1 Tax=Eutreptiella gymnastica TaxID=73025 RepID=A0A7S4CWJ9_9EUGL
MSLCCGDSSGNTHPSIFSQCGRAEKEQGHTKDNRQPNNVSWDWENGLEAPLLSPKPSLRYSFQSPDVYSMSHKGSREKLPTNIATEGEDMGAQNLSSGAQ